MKKETYLLKPSEIEVYPVFDGTDVILRRNFEEIEVREEEEETKVWECDEVQFKYRGKLTEEKIKEKFDYWYALGEGKNEIEAIDKEAETKNEPSVVERLDALESGLAELAEVMCNG